MIVNSVNDYFAAVEDCDRVQGLLDRGRAEFSGYGLELFERGLVPKIKKLRDEIQRYEVESGFLDLPSVAAEGVKYSGQFNIAGGQVVPESSFANAATGAAITAADIRMSGYICNIVLNEVPTSDLPNYFYIGLAQRLAPPIPSVALGSPKSSLRHVPSRPIWAVVGSQPSC